MTRLGKILAVSALVAAPLAVTAIPSQPAEAAHVFIGAAPIYAAPAPYCDPYYCGYGYTYAPSVGISVGGWGGHAGWHHWRH